MAAPGNQCSIDEKDDEEDYLDNRSVLIVEDEDISRRALAMLLGHCGYPTEAVESGEAALQLMSDEGMPEIALVDLDLPGMNGLDLISHMETIDPSVFIVLITAAGFDRVGEAVRQRRLAYMRKPIDFSRLLGMIREKRLSQQSAH